MGSPLRFSEVETPIGTFRIVYQERKVFLVDLLEKGLPAGSVPAEAVRQRRPFPAGSPPHQLLEYFRGTRTAFELEPEPASDSEFDLKVWSLLSGIRAGRTITYGELARRAGYSGAARAVGGAMARNPIPLVVPCHRVVGLGGSLTGFGLGLWRKRWLLAHEGAWPLRSKTSEGPSNRAQRTLDQVRDDPVVAAPPV